VSDAIVVTGHFSLLLYAAATTADSSHFHFHCLRHTYATTLVTAGANVKEVQELLGHSDIKITLNTYSHVTRQTRKRAVGIFENAIHGVG
jgi:site-specific recombinase XerD